MNVRHVPIFATSRFRTIDEARADLRLRMAVQTASALKSGMRTRLSFSHLIRGSPMPVVDVLCSQVLLTACGSVILQPRIDEWFLNFN